MIVPCLRKQAKKPMVRYMCTYLSVLRLEKGQHNILDVLVPQIPAVFDAVQASDLFFQHLLLVFQSRYFKLAVGEELLQLLYLHLELAFLGGRRRVLRERRVGARQRRHGVGCLDGRRL